MYVSWIVQVNSVIQPVQTDATVLAGRSPMEQLPQFRSSLSIRDVAMLSVSTENFSPAWAACHPFDSSVVWSSS